MWWYIFSYHFRCICSIIANLLYIIGRHFRKSASGKKLFLPSNDIVLILLCLQHSCQVVLLLHLHTTLDYGCFLPFYFCFIQVTTASEKGKSVLRFVTVLHIPRHYNKHPSHTVLVFLLPVDALLHCVSILFSIACS